MLLAAGASPACRRRDGRGSALHLAARSGCAPVFAALLAAGADLAPRPVGSLASNYGDAAAADGGAWSETIATVHWLQLAVERGHAAVLRLALDAGLGVETRDADLFKKTPLHNAVFYGREECARLLVERGADVNACFSWTRVLEADESGISSREVSVARARQPGASAGDAGAGEFMWRHDRSVLDCALKGDVGRPPLSADFLSLLRARGAKAAEDMDMGAFRGLVGLTDKARGRLAEQGFPAP